MTVGDREPRPLPSRGECYELPAPETRGLDGDQAPYRAGPSAGRGRAGARTTEDGMGIDLEGSDPALYAEFVWLSAVTGLPKEHLVMLAIREGFPIARARYNFDSYSDTPRNRLALLNMERRAVKDALRRAKKAPVGSTD